MTRLIVAGVSTRAMAESAARAGFAVTAIDGYADLDQHAGVDARAVTPFTPRTAAEAARPLAADAVAYLSSFENDPDAVARLAVGRDLWGNPPAVLRRVRDPRLLHDSLTAVGMPVPRLGAGHGGPCVVKPIASGGGARVRAWNGQPVPDGHYLQERIEGRVGSIAFVAAGGRAQVLGVFEQLVGLAAFGASGYRYCGSLFDGRPSEASTRQAEALATVLASAFDLVGVNGVDIVDSNGVLFPIEVNPRWSASMELLERASGVSVFGAHADACRARTLSTTAVPGSSAVHGKAVVFARHDVTAADTSRFVTDLGARDVPRPGTHIRAGEPVCTVFADAPTRNACLAALERRAQAVHDALHEWSLSR